MSSFSADGVNLNIDTLVNLVLIKFILRLTMNRKQSQILQKKEVVYFVTPVHVNADIY